MAFRYMNPGYVHLLNSDAQATQVTGTNYSRTGVAFSKTSSSTAAITLPDFKQGDDFWGRFDWYLNRYSNFECSFPCCRYGKVIINADGGGLLQLRIFTVILIEIRLF